MKENFAFGEKIRNGVYKLFPEFLYYSFIL